MSRTDVPVMCVLIYNAIILEASPRRHPEDSPRRSFSSQACPVVVFRSVTLYLSFWEGNAKLHSG